MIETYKLPVPAVIFGKMWQALGISLVFLKFLFRNRLPHCPVLRLLDSGTLGTGRTDFKFNLLLIMRS